ncbi:MAG: glycosyltransferase family 4 protein [Sphingobium sp.]
MRILHLGMLYPPHVLGGAELSMATLAQAQARSGHDVAVACTTPGAFTDETRDGVRIFRMPHATRFWAEDWPAHGRLERFWRKAAMPFNASLRRHFDQVLDAVGPDIVHSHSMTDVSTGLWPAVAVRGIGLVHTLRDYDLMCVQGSMHHGGRGCGPACRLLSLPKRRHHRHIDAVAAVSGDILRRHVAHGLFAALPPDRRQVIWNSAPLAGIDGQYERPDRTGQPFTFGYLGRVTAEKGVGLLIDAFGRMANPDVRLLVAGASPNGFAPFAEAAKGLAVRFAGPMDPLAFFESIDLLVVPSIWPEPFGRVVVEAYGAGVPVLAARIGGLPDLIAGDKEAWLVPPGDADALASRMAAIAGAGRSALPSSRTFAPILKATGVEAMEQAYARLYALAR